MVDLEALRRTIETMPPQGRVAIVTRRWLEEVDRDLAELVELRAQRPAQS